MGGRQGAREGLCLPTDLLRTIPVMCAKRPDPGPTGPCWARLATGSLVELGLVLDRDPYESWWSYTLRKVRDLWAAEPGQDLVEQRVFVTVISFSITLAVVAAGGTLFIGLTGRF